MNITEVYKEFYGIFLGSNILIFVNVWHHSALIRYMYIKKCNKQESSHYLHSTECCPYLYCHIHDVSAAVRLGLLQVIFLGISNRTLYLSGKFQEMSPEEGGSVQRAKRREYGDKDEDNIPNNVISVNSYNTSPQN